MLGNAHAGNTWLQSWLSRHPLIFTAFESRMFYSLFDLYSNITSRDTSWHNTESARIVLNKVVTDILTKSPSYNNQELILEMTPGHSEFLGFISEIFPDAYFLITQRDGRRVIASKKKRSLKRSGSYTMKTLKSDVDLWIKRTNQISSVSSKNNLKIPYYSACQNAQHWGEKIISFLGIEKHEDLAAWQTPWRYHNAVFIEENIYTRNDKGENFWMEYLTQDEIVACSAMEKYLHT